jgi:phage regulator Rha-like protein
MAKSPTSAMIPATAISHRIYFVRKTRIMLDADLAQLYGVTTKNLNKAVKRNADRFPADFMFQLKPREMQFLKFQSGTSSRTNHGGRRYKPYAFTEHGVAMLSSVLHSDRAVQVNIAIMRAFLQLRAMLATHEDLRRKINEMEKRYDSKFHAVFSTLRQMLETPIPSKRQIGFHARSGPIQRGN